MLRPHRTDDKNLSTGRVVNTLRTPLPPRSSHSVTEGVLPRFLKSSARETDGPFMDSVIHSGLLGVQRGMESASRNSERVIHSFFPDSDEDPIEPLVALQLDKRQVEASLQVIKTGEELIGTVLDIIG